MARDLVPLTAPPPDRPLAPSQACDACGTLLDPLRTQLVLVFDDGYRFLCGPACERTFREGVRHRATRTPHESRPAVTPLSSPRIIGPRAIPLATPPLIVEQPGRSMWIGVGAVVVAMLLGLAGNRPSAALASAVFSGIAVVCSLVATWSIAKSTGWLAWGLGPIGAALAAIAAPSTARDGSASWLVVEGAALAAAAMLVRGWLDQNARRPVDAAVHQLIHKLPARAHVPVSSASDPLAMSMQLADTSAIRSGEEIVAMRGETLAVDGVVQAGDAKVLLYPSATIALRRKSGDSVLAGATVVEGALRVLATRVGDERSLVRLTRFGSNKERDPALLSRVSKLVARYGGLGTLGLAASVLLLAKTGAPSAPLAAASAVLLSAPLLSLLRAAESSLRAAAAAAGARGILYQSASGLDATGRATVVAMSPYGVLTEARPVVVELHVFDDSDRDQLIAMAAAAERSAPGNAIALAIERFAHERRLPVLEVRRPVHHPGKGVTAISPQGQPLVVGSRRLLLEEGISVAVADAEAARAEAAERSPLFIAIDGRVRAILTLQYELRVGARPAIQRMYDLGLEVVLLTGEQRGAVEVFARGLDIEHVKADLSPESRGQEVRSLREAGGTVAALGRPGEDDAALAAADAGIVLAAAGGSATERAVALVSDDVRDAAAALFIAKAARESAWRAVGVAAVAFALVVAAAAAGLIVPGIAALLTAAVDAYCLPAGARLLHRIALRLPARS